MSKTANYDPLPGQQGYDAQKIIDDLHQRIANLEAELAEEQSRVAREPWPTCPTCGKQSPGGVWDGRCHICWAARVADLEAVVERLRDDGLMRRVAEECNDDRHDDSWCPTCEARADGIEAYRAAVLDTVVPDEDRDAEEGADDAETP